MRARFRGNRRSDGAVGRAGRWQADDYGLRVPQLGTGAGSVHGRYRAIQARAVRSGERARPARPVSDRRQRAQFRGLRTPGRQGDVHAAVPGRRLWTVRVDGASAGSDARDPQRTARLAGAGTGEKSHAAPIDAAQAAPPIRKWSGADGAWMGAARFVTSRKIAAEKFRLVRQGPAVVEYEARYTFDPRANTCSACVFRPACRWPWSPRSSTLARSARGRYVAAGPAPRLAAEQYRLGAGQRRAAAAGAEVLGVQDLRGRETQNPACGGSGRRRRPTACAVPARKRHGLAGDDLARRPLGRRQRRRPGLGRRSRTARLGPEHGTGPAARRFVAASDGPVRLVPRGRGNHGRLAVQRPLVPLVDRSHR